MIDKLIEISKKAGAAIMEVYESDSFNQRQKADDSPVTEADLRANKIIVEELKQAFPEIPVLTEESEHPPFEQRVLWGRYFLVDPLDGTKEFIKKNGEFTVNIALIEERSPILGVVYAPAKDILYFNLDDKSAYKEVDGEKIKLPVEGKKEDIFVMVASRSHLNASTEAFLEDLKCKYDDVELVRLGSSLKLCLVAEGAADAYPRLGPTSEWDTAAAHAIVKASGGEVYQYGTKDSLVYNKENLLNPHFEVVRTR